VRIGPQLERLLQEAIGSRSVTPAGSQADAATGPAPIPAAPRKRKEYRDPSEVDDDELLEVLRRNRWSVKPTAEELKVSRTSLYALIDRNPKIRKASEIGRDELVRVREECGGDLEEMGRRLEVSSSGLRQRMKELEI
jgi:two-component system nitrogen regulation response regulator GlnG